MGILRIPNEMSLTKPALVKQCIQWLKDNHGAIVHGKHPERKFMRYEITGDDIPEGEFHLRITTLVENVYTIKIET